MCHPLHRMRRDVAQNVSAMAHSVQAVYSGGRPGSVNPCRVWLPSQ
jgi:hypothetical protein